MFTPAVIVVLRLLALMFTTFNHPLYYVHTTIPHTVILTSLHCPQSTCVTTTMSNVSHPLCYVQLQSPSLLRSSPIILSTASIASHPLYSVHRQSSSLLRPSPVTLSSPSTCSHHPVRPAARAARLDGGGPGRRHASRRLRVHLHEPGDLVRGQGQTYYEPPILAQTGRNRRGGSSSLRKPHNGTENLII